MPLKVDPACLFCRIVKGDIPAFKLLESETMLAFLDVGPVARGHALVIPKYHAVKVTDLPDDQMVDILPACRKIALASGHKDFNILQNNGRAAHQHVDHVHFHVIPKPEGAGKNEGLVVGWPRKTPPKEELEEVWKQLKEELDKARL